MEIKIPEPIKMILGEIIQLESEFDNPDKKESIKLSTNNLFNKVQNNAEKLNKLIETIICSDKINDVQLVTCTWFSYFSDRSHFKDLLSTAHVVGNFIRSHNLELSKTPYLIIEIGEPVQIWFDEVQGKTILINIACLGQDGNTLVQLINECYHPGQESIKTDGKSINIIKYKKIQTDLQSLRISITTPKPSPILPIGQEKKIPLPPQVIDIPLGVQRNDPRVQVCWAPLNKSKKPLGNCHALIFGISGSGKTTLIKNLIKELSVPRTGSQNAVPCLFFDFHGELTGKEGKAFVEEIGATILDPSAGLPLNPLYVPKDSETGKRNSFLFVSSQVSQSIGSVFELTPIQITILETAIENVYLQEGFIKDDPKTWNRPTPSFNKIWDALQEMAEDDKNKSVHFAITRLKPLFINNIFRGNNEGIEMVFNGPTIVRLNALPNLYLRTALVNFFLLSLYEKILANGPSTDIKLCCIVDEAHKLAKVQAFKEMFREARKFGISLVNSSQRLKDFHEDIISNSGTVIGFKMMSTDAARFSKELGTKNRSKVISLLQQLEVGEAVIRNNQYLPFTVFKATKST